ncbi:type III-A CRISPR-associated CARF protein Csm6 [Bacillota bacterium LCP21S3_D9]
MSKVLFSPVGGTDPISENNLHDGSLLHICRCYQPDVVYLYMSKEILNHHKQDDRYLYCLKKLDDLQGRSTEYHVIERPEMENVQEFDVFYRDFRSEIQKITSGMSKDDSLYLNISSGTPAMKSGLLVLKTLGEFNCTAVQVTTPMREMNEHTHRENDIETLWSLDYDNQENFVNRCSEVECPTLSMIHQETMLKNLIAKYDYAGALTIAQTMPQEDTSNYLAWLNLAYDRYQLDLKQVSKILGAGSLDFVFPIRDAELCKYFEYALTLQVRMMKREYADFVRALSPILAWLFDRIIRTQTTIKIDSFCYRGKDGIRRWSRDKLEGNGQAVLNVLIREFPDFHYGTVYSSTFVPLIVNYCSGNSVLCTLVQDLRTVEKEVRNLAAHEVECITDDTIRKLTGFSANQIMMKVRKAFYYAEINVREDQWQSYEEMNKKIIAEIGREGRL